MTTERTVNLTGQKASFKDVEHPTVYSNMMGIGATPFDIAIIFGEVHQGTPEEVVGLPRVKVLLAPEQARNLVIMLQSTLENFVAGNGQLRESGKVTMPVAQHAPKSSKPQ